MTDFSCEHRGELRAFCELQKLPDGTWAALPFTVGGEALPAMTIIHRDPEVALETAAWEAAAMAEENDEILEEAWGG